MSLLLELPQEIISDILVCVGITDLKDLANTALSCSQLAESIYQDIEGSTCLWREIHLALYDDPRRSVQHQLQDSSVIDWRGEATERYRTKRFFLDAKDEVRTRSNEELQEEIFSELDKFLLISQVLRQLEESAPHDTKSRQTSRNLAFLRQIGSLDQFYSLMCKIYRDGLDTKRTLRRRRSSALEPSKEAEEQERGKKLELNSLMKICNDLGKIDALDSCHPTTVKSRLAESNAGKKRSSTRSTSAESYKFMESIGISRSFVYLVNRFSALNDFGPFHPDGTVDWNTVACVHRIMDANVMYASRRSRLGPEPRTIGSWGAREWMTAQSPGSIGLEGDVGLPLTGLSDEEKKDWAGLLHNGKPSVRRGSYAFIDFNESIELNFLPGLEKKERNETLRNVFEAIGDYMKQVFTLGLDEKDKALKDITSPLPRSEILPPLKFSGRGYAGEIEGDGHAMRGEVVITPDHQVKWTWVVTYGGQDRWKCTGVQIGGRKSKRAIVGIWSSVDAFDENIEGIMSPCGPWMYWPVGDEESDAELMQNAVVDPPMLMITM